ncbi:MAG: MaoC family dehydratase [Pseudorhodoplanes sp.]
MTASASDVAALRARSVLWRKGTSFEDFTPGRVFKHHWGRTITEADNTIFTTLTLHYNPRYFNAEFARAEGHPNMVVCPMLVFNTVFGLSVQDLSEAGGMFLGIEELTFREPVYPGDTLTATSEVLDCRDSKSDEKHGIATWHTRGFNQRGELVIDFKRTNLVRKEKYR